MQRIEGFFWADWVVDKLDWKHGVAPEEVEETFFNPPYKVRRTKGDKYLLYGRSHDGRYLFVVFVWEGKYFKVISGRDITSSERRYFSRK